MTTKPPVNAPLVLTAVPTPDDLPGYVHPVRCMICGRLDYTAAPGPWKTCGACGHREAQEAKE